jgi:hypothetical protein
LFLGTVFRDFNPDRGQFENLAAFALLALEWRRVPRHQLRAALRAACAFAEAVLDNSVGCIALPQRVAAMALLATGFAP